MRVAFTLSFIMILMLPSAGIAQDSKEHELKILTGFNDYANKDQMVSPFVYTDINYPIHLRYDVSNSDFIRSFEVNYLYGTATTETDNTRETHSGFMRFGYLRSIASPFNNFHVFAGGRLGAETIVDQASFETSHKNYATNSSGYLALSGGLAANVEYQLKQKHTFSFEPYVSIAGYIYRPGYSLYHHSSFREALKSAKLSSYGDFLNLTTNVAYQLQLSERLEFSLNYNLNYLRYANPFEVRVMQNSMLVGLGVNL